jgi:cold shock protein
MRDDRVLCQNCGRQMVPRLITYRGAIHRTVCPFCASTYEDFTPEFPRVVLWILGIGIVLCILLAQFGV